MSTIARPHRPTDFVDTFMQKVEQRSPHEPEFHQAVREVIASLELALDEYPEYRSGKILERLVEPERVVQFRVCWVNDAGEIEINRGYRVAFNSAIGPYKGGLRFHPSVNLNILKFLGFEQIFKNSLTTLSIGAAKGGADFNPKGRSDAEVMRFCQTFMCELYRHIGHNTDVPAGDIGVGTREIGYLFGMYKKLTNEFTGVLTGRSPEWGGSLIRTEATGYGCVYFAQNMLEANNDALEGKTCLVSGAGNVAQYVIEKLLDLGARPVSVSDSDGLIYDPHGIDHDKLEWLKHHKNVDHGRVKTYTEAFSGAEYVAYDPEAGENVLWQYPADCAFPCATQNELNVRDAQHLVDNAIRCVCEGANMPVTVDAQAILLDAGVLYGPAKAANAGGVAVSALEMAQGSQRLAWTRDEVDARLKMIMRRIHDTCRDTAEQFGTPGHYLHGANIAGFLKVAKAMYDQGVV